MYQCVDEWAIYVASNYSEESTQDSDAIKLCLRKPKNIRSLVPLKQTNAVEGSGLRNTSNVQAEAPLSWGSAKEGAGRECWGQNQ